MCRRAGAASSCLVVVVVAGASSGGDGPHFLAPRVQATQPPPQFGSRGWWAPLSGLHGARAHTFVPASRTTPSDHILLACTHFRRHFGANDDAVAFRGLWVSDFGGRTGGRGWKVKSAMSAIEGRGRAGGGGVVDVLVYGLSCLGFWVRSSRLGRICGTRCGGGDQGAVVLQK